MDDSDTANPRTVTNLVVDRASIGTTELRTSDLGPLADGHVRLSIDRFALTANTITYAQFGDMLAYWDFYPLADANGFGNVPAIGWGTVAESRVEGIEPGGRYFSWYPMATSVDVLATPTAEGFRDDGAHRAPHAPTYRSFVRTDHDAMYTGLDDEGRHALLRGLFITGLLIDAFFSANSYLGAEQAIVLSASSKTALGYAYSARHAAEDGRPRLIGATSPSNVEFVRGLDMYDDVMTYDDLSSVAEVPSVVIDMAGSGSAIAAVHRRLGDLIAHSMVVGKSHHDAAPEAVESGPRPEMFFAPGEIQTRLAEWGVEGYRQRVSGALAGFVEDSRRWLTEQRVAGPEAAKTAWNTAFTGTVPPSVGVLVSLQTH